MDYEKEIKAIEKARSLLKKMDDEQNDTSFYADADGRGLSNTYQQVQKYHAETALDRFKEKRTKYSKVIPLKKTIAKWSVVAAALLLVVGSLGIYLQYFYQPAKDLYSAKAQEDVDPGGNRAILTLADGTVVNLNEDQKGIIVAGQTINYDNGNPISTSENNSSSETTNPSTANIKESILSLRTPRGGQYQLQLSDGTKVWLNAGSELRYPIQFSGDSREVELIGEAYFEVTQRYSKTAKGRHLLPFIVRSDRQVIRVLGTSFNVYNYQGEPIRTTLLTGHVEVSAVESPHKQILTPGQQLAINGDKVTLHSVDANLAIGWKNGVFNLSDVALADIMKQISRWYDIEVVYQSAHLKNLTFEGSVPRYENLKSLLAIIEKAGSVSFEVKNKIVYVKKKQIK